MTNFGKGAIALVRGTLRGMGRVADCELLARRHPIPGADRFGMRRYGYTECSVVQAPFDLPDGEYMARTEDGQIVPATKLQGLWLIEEEQRRAA